MQCSQRQRVIQRSACKQVNHSLAVAREGMFIKSKNERKSRVGKDNETGNDNGF